MFLKMGIGWLWLCNTCRWLGRTTFSGILLPVCFQLACAARELSCRTGGGQGWGWHFRCLGAAVELTTAIPSPDPPAASHTPGPHVFSCMTKATSKLPLQVTHFVRLEGVRTGRGSCPCESSGSSSLTFYPPSLPHRLPFRCPALTPDRKTTF